MPLSYSARLRRDLRDWQECGLIQPEQAERIAAHALAPRGLRHLQTALALCILLLVAPSVIAFVAANWSAMPPSGRLIVLFLANAAAVFATYLAAQRRARDQAGTAHRLVDGLATLSLAIATATLALVGQTFHVAADPRGFAGTVAVLGLATALVARSSGAAVIACIALVASDAGPGALDLGLLRGEAVSESEPWFWMVGPALFLASLSGWLRARETTLLLLLVVLSNHLGSTPAGSMFLLPPDRILSVAALALALGHVLARLSRENPWATRLHGGAQALARAAVGLSLLGIVMVSAPILVPLRASASALSATSDLLVLAAAALTLLVWLIASLSREPATVWTVWGGIVPALILVVAGHIEDRRELYGWGLALTAGLTLGMLAASRNLIAFSGNLLLCALLLTLALFACRWAARRIDRRAA
jgi:uncharacterized membrane protein